MDECWEWNGSRTPQGYGVATIHGPNGRKRAIAHRVMYQIFRGPIPDDMELDHLCRNRACFNPGHLEPVTHQENDRRKLAAAGIEDVCINGHPRIPENRTKYRQCRLCVNAHGRAWRARRGN